MTHIVINRSKGTVDYHKDSTAMLKTELPAKVLSYLAVMPKCDHIHLYSDQIEWLRGQAARQALIDRKIQVISVEREN